MNLSRAITIRLMPLLAMLSVSAPLSFRQAHAVSQETHQYGEVLVHYVRLKGPAENNGLNSRTLKILHAGCVEINKRKGRPANPLPPGGVPEPSSMKVLEIYYSANRTVADSQIERYELNKENCALYKGGFRTRILDSGAGSCTMNLTKKTAYGQCDAAEHRVAPPRPLPAIPPKPLPGADLTIKGIPCKHFTSSIGRPPVGGPTIVITDWCIANPKSDFSIPDAAFHLTMPGLLLRLHSGHKLEAEEVMLHKRVSEEVFSVPSNLKITAFNLPRE